MSILLKGLDMPEGDKALVVVINSNGTIDRPNWQWDYTLIKGAKAISIPDHGDLIDKDALIKDLIDDYDFPIEGLSLDDICYALENAPVVIPAERIEDETY